MFKYSPAEKPNKLVAVVVPLSNRTTFTEDEKISLKHLLHFLPEYDKYFIAPEGLGVKVQGVDNKYFNAKFFGSLSAHNRLLLSEIFYQTFSDYRFILNYHLDSLVFSDQLTEWCEKDYDFIGPPWIEHEDAPYSDYPIYNGKVGNGGFSLRKIESFLKVLNSRKRYMDASALRALYSAEPWYARFLKFPKKYMRYFPHFNNVKFEIAKFRDNEEAFWSNRAQHYYPAFKIPSVETALQFGFECVPEYCFKVNNRTLPFGCHAWPKYDRVFWEKYILK